MSNKTPQQQHSRSECGDRQPCDPARSLLRDYSVELREMAFKKWLRPSGNSWDFLFSPRAELSLGSPVLNAEVEDKSSQTKTESVFQLSPCGQLPTCLGRVVDHTPNVNGEMGRLACSVFSQVLLMLAGKAFEVQPEQVVVQSLGFGACEKTWDLV